MRTSRTIQLAALVAAAAVALTSCSSSSDAPASSGAASASTASSVPMPSVSGSAGSASTTSAAALACAAYFSLDLLNSQYAGGAVANGNMTEQQVKSDFKKLLAEMVTQADLAATDGTADGKLSINALRMKKMILTLKKTQSLSDLSKDNQVKFAKQSLRVQRSCDRAGYPLPADNVTARTSAGLA
jgi:hypothetical protein